MKLRLTGLGCYVSTVRHSALFINGAKASENFVFVVPHIDFSERIKNKELLQEELIQRKLNVDLGKVQKLWSMYEEIKHQKLINDEKKAELSRELSKLIKDNSNADDINRLKIQVNLIKDNLKKLKVPLWSAEEAAIVEVLKLPNALHPQTPDSENKILYTHLSPPNNKKDHLKIANDLKLVHFKKNENYYLKGDAALFELGAKFYFNDMLKKNKFVQLSNPDFVKSVVVEGCGINHTDPYSTFILHHNEDTKVNVNSRLHLTGGGSLCSFMAHYAKNVIYSKMLPLKLFAMGRQYKPSLSVEDSLFHVSQSSVVQMFGVTKNDEDLESMLNDTIELLKLAYSQFGYHFRMSIVTADKLCMWESLRVIVEMYSSSLESYVEVANISLSGDFISKRLMFTYVDNKNSHFPHLMSGTVLNVPKFLACVLEQDEEFVLPKQFQVNNWIT